MGDDRDRHRTYRIRAHGRLDQSWSPWFNGMLIECTSAGDPVITTLTGPVVDQPALRGILNKLWDLNLTLVSVEAEETEDRRPTMPPEARRKIISWIRGASFGMIGYAALVLISVGRWDWLWGWVYIGLMAAALAAHVIVLVPINPALLADRSEGLRQAGAKPWDRPVVMVMSVFYLATMIVGGLDARWEWSRDVPLAIYLTGLLLFILSWVVFLWAMASNPFFSESVRIQPEHQVAVGGPYRVVRHPGYAGACLGFMATPLLLGSWWAFIPAILATATYVLRTALEDRTLQAELTGYTEYAARVRYRLAPGIW
jgi:protein-S-isoprenylcysteine O-methyltransferase Ste14